MGFTPKNIFKSADQAFKQTISEIKDGTRYLVDKTKDTLSPLYKAVSDTISGRDGIEFIQGGGMLRLSRVKDDIIRQTNFLKSSNGIQWILLQQGLQATNAVREIKLDNLRVFNPLSLIANVSGIHIPRHSMFGNYDLYGEYIKKINSKENFDKDIDNPKNQNRMIRIYNTLKNPTSVITEDFTVTNPLFNKFLSNTKVNNLKNKILNSKISKGISKSAQTVKNSKFGLFVNKVININKDTINGRVIPELSGMGGPGSFFGIGKTLIHVGESGVPLDQSDYNYIRFTPEAPYNFTYEDYGNNVAYASVMLSDKLQPGGFPNQYGKDNTSGGIPITLQSLNGLNSYQSINDFSRDGTPVNQPWNVFNQSQIIDYFATGGMKPVAAKDYYKEKNFQNRLSMYNGTKNSIDALYAYNNANSYTDPIEDMVKVIFSDTSISKIIQFRGTIDGLTDKIAPEWANVRYIGRPDEVYTYNGYKRNIGFSFIIVPNSEKEMDIIYNKVNQLQRYLLPSMSSGGQMTGQLLKLKIGNWFADENNNGVAGYLNACDVTIDNEYPWDLLKEIPMILKVTVDFVVIGNSAYNQNTYLIDTYNQTRLDNKKQVDKRNSQNLTVSVPIRTIQTPTLR